MYLLSSALHIKGCCHCKGVIVDVIYEVLCNPESVLGIGWILVRDFCPCVDGKGSCGQIQPRGWIYDGNLLLLHCHYQIRVAGAAGVVRENLVRIRRNGMFELCCRCNMLILLCNELLCFDQACQRVEMQHVN